MSQLRAPAMARRHITQGEYGIGTGDQGSITTILGSCIAACLYDPEGGFGGMNHFLVPESGGGGGTHAASFGVNAMELLINDLIKQGALRHRLKAKVFGGARMIAGLSDVGARNSDFIMAFLRREAIECTGHSLGGEQARRVEFWPETGRARQKFLGEGAVREVVPVAPPVNDIELF
jgi:chemotaxis protein CheD